MLNLPSNIRLQAHHPYKLYEYGNLKPGQHLYSTCGKFLITIYTMLCLPELLCFTSYRSTQQEHILFGSAPRVSLTLLREDVQMSCRKWCAKLQVKSQASSSVILTKNFESVSLPLQRTAWYLWYANLWSSTFYYASPFGFSTLQHRTPARRWDEV